ncbi:hypothetical protein HK098_004575 [Nowakowskiella sp. JEL0407]|nr:hypothetical protein HK098_004575 [Nowakowskiella sp. JEL0407]
MLGTAEEHAFKGTNLSKTIFVENDFDYSTDHLDRMEIRAFQRFFRDCKSTAEQVWELGRPGLHEMLAAVYPYYDIVIWSQTSWRWLEAKITELGMLTSPNYKIAFVLDKTSMFSINTRRTDGKMVQHQVKALGEVAKFWYMLPMLMLIISEIIWSKFPNFSASNTIHIDDLSRNFAMNPSSGLKISPFKNAILTRQNDVELFHLTTYLLQLAVVSDFNTLNHKGLCHLNRSLGPIRKWYCTAKGGLNITKLKLYDDIKHKNSARIQADKGDTLLCKVVVRKISHKSFSGKKLGASSNKFRLYSQLIVSLILLFISTSLVNGQLLPVRPWSEVRAQFASALTLYTSSPSSSSPVSFNVTLHWQIVNPTTRNETLHMALAIITPFVNTPTSQINKTAFFWPYIAVGFQKSMVEDKGFVVCSLDGSFVNATIIERGGTENYGPPPASVSLELTKPLTGGFTNGVFYCEFSRPTASSDEEIPSIKISSPQPLIWAFNPAPTKNVRSEYFSYHGFDRRGYLQMLLQSGTGNLGDVSSFKNKTIHGWGMSLIFMVLFPSAVLWSRYLRSVPNWLFIHMGMQIVGATSVLGFLAVIIIAVGSVDFDQPHTIIGFILIVLVIIQVGLGVLNLLGLMNEKYVRARDISRRIHAFMGILLLLTSFVNVGLGLDHLYPFVDRDDRGAVFWYLFFGISSFWVALYVFLEIFFWLRIRNVEKRVKVDDYGKKTAKAVVPLDPVATGTKKRVQTVNVNQDGYYIQPDVSVVKNTSVQTRMTVTHTEIPLPEVDPGLTGILRKYTWESLDQQIAEGKLLVVGNGQYVYDVSKWLKSHPGGQTVIFSSAGTDISNDYWHEAGFDAADFTPADPKPEQSENRKIPVLRKQQSFRSETSSSSNGSNTNLVDMSLINQYTVAAQMRITPAFTNSDWKRVTKARRPHVHSELALRRLAQLVVGELVPEPYPTSKESSTRSLSDVPTGHLFSRNEYRRYALTEKKLITAAGSSESVNPVYRLRFCLLYPHDLRDKEPLDGFLPGECVEIQVRSGKSAPVSRYYTPVSGNLAAFEIYVKVIPYGFVSRILTRQKVGDRQIKIRGPFGAPLLAPHKPLAIYEANGNWVPDNIILFGAGSGLLPFLQLVQFLLLPLFEPLIAIADYQGTMTDEITIRRNDRIICKAHYYDGWAVGLNLNTNQSGFFPLSITHPRNGLSSSTKMTVINSIRSFDDLYGMDVMEGSTLAYPRHISFHHFVKKGFSTANDSAAVNLDGSRSPLPPLTFSTRSVTLPCGYVHDGGITDQSVSDIVEPLIGDRSSRRIFICGPPKYQSSIVDYLNELGVYGEDVRILPHDRWIDSI